MRGFDDAPVQPHIALFDEPFEKGAGRGGKFFAQILVEPRVGQGSFDNKMFHAAGGHWGTHLLAAFCGVPSFFKVMRKINPTPVQIALSAMLKAGKPSSRPLRCTM